MKKILCLIFIFLLLPSKTGKANDVIHKGEIEIECLKSAIIGEISIGSRYEKESFLWFFHYQERKHGMGYCSEFVSFKKGGARKYSSSAVKSLFRIEKEKKDIKLNKEIEDIIDNFLYGETEPDENQKKLKHATNMEAKRYWGKRKWQKTGLIQKIEIGRTIYSQHKWS